MSVLTRASDIKRAKKRLAELEQLSANALLERAWDEIRALCGSEGSPKRWTMTIPVDASRDSDVLFGEVLMRFANLLDRHDKLQSELALVLEVSIARGESLGYEDEDYRDRLEDLREIIGERGMK